MFRESCVIMKNWVLTHPNTLKHFCLVAFLLLVGVTTTSPGFAVDSLGDMGGQLEGEAKGLAGGIRMIAYLAGFIMVVVGIAMMANSKKTQQPMTVPVILLICGIMLVSVNFVIGLGSSTFFGSDQSQTNELFN